MIMSDNYDNYGDPKKATKFRLVNKRRRRRFVVSLLTYSAGKFKKSYRPRVIFLRKGFFFIHKLFHINTWYII